MSAACYLICGIVSEDNFSEFRFGLVGLGEDDFRAVLGDPDAGLAGLPTVEAMAEGHASPFTLHGERIRSAPSVVYGHHYLVDRAEFAREPTTPRFEPADAPDIAIRLPRLHEFFPDRG